MNGIWWVETDADGRVVSNSPEAARAFNYSSRGLRGRDLLLFFPEDHRRITRELDVASRGLDVAPLRVTLQPRDRRAFPATVTLAGTSRRTLVWNISTPPC